MVELTSKTTRREDQVMKHGLYRDVLRIREYFQFDPTEDYLNPPLQGFRLVEGEYVPITPVDGRLPSEVLGLHLEQDGQELRLYNPERCARLMKPEERASAAEQRAESAEQRAESAEQRAQAGQALVREVGLEIERLRRENEGLRRRMGSTE